MPEIHTRPSRSFRLICRREHASLVEDFLREQGFAFATETFFPLARRLLEEPFPLGASLASVFGYIYLQDRSSMLPPLALNPPPGAAVLDMCASPGSKASLLAQLVGEAGFVLANEPNPRRLALLRQNLLRLNLLQAGTCSFPGEDIPMPPASWEYIQLDPPCSGWGTEKKHPRVRALWKDDKVLPLARLQRRLLKEAARLLAPGGRLVYSTCTTNPRENEEQIRFATDELGLVLLPLRPFAGFSFDTPAPGAEGSLLVNGHASGAQGFFLALLTKPGGVETPRTPPDPAPAGAALRHRPPPDALEDGVRALLPPGVIALAGENMCFLPQTGLERLPGDLRWQGCVLGKMQGGRVRLSPRLHRLLPPLPGTDSLNLDSIAPLADLVAGRGLSPPPRGKRAFLYWRGLPLARLSVKGSRALLSP
ncbi:MAG: RsmB/NOP family class I SAM-dependent RNA methyltransferase [Deltaproteobacteria bacterium]|nr:RsmB/NOP family class I SAM-dependent RNA methyltransferase [Deltaproteobacteria bacterium]